MKYWFSLILLISLFLTACPDDNSTTPTEINTDCEREIVKNNVLLTVQGFSNIFSDQNFESYSRESLFRAYISKSRFFDDSSGYFYVETLDAVMVAHGFKDELIGTSRIDVQDSKGNYYVREMLDSINDSGEGFVEFYFTNPTTGKDEKKTGFVAKVPDYDYFAGSGYYNERKSINDINLNCSQLLIKNELKSMVSGFEGIFADLTDDIIIFHKFIKSFLKNIQLEENNNFLLAIDESGDCIGNNYNQEIVGINLYSVTDVNSKEYIKEIIEMVSSKNSGFANYTLPDSENQTVLEYEFYSEKVPDTDIILIVFMPKT